MTFWTTDFKVEILSHSSTLSEVINFWVFLGSKYLSVCKSKESLWIDIWFEEFDSNFVFIYQQELSGPTDSGDSEEREKVISKLCFKKIINLESSVIEWYLYI